MYEQIQFNNNPADKRKTPEQKLWTATLNLFLVDAVSHISKKKAPDHLINTWSESYYDLVSCGELTRRLAFYNDLDAEYLSLKFRKHINGLINCQETDLKPHNG